MIEKKKSSDMEKLAGDIIEKLAGDITLELRQVIDTLNLLVDSIDDLDDKYIALQSTPCVLIKALEVTVKKSDEVWNYLREKSKGSLN